MEHDAVAPVQAKVTIELTGSASEVGNLLEAISSVLIHTATPDVASRTPFWWSPENATAFVRRLKRPALHALRTIAAGAPKVRVAAVQREMQHAGLAMTPGALSSIGFAVRALGAPAPFVRDNYQRVYLMDTEVAAVLLQVIEAEQGRRRPDESRAPAVAVAPRETLD